jgi:hypothetical protein
MSIADIKGSLLALSKQNIPQSTLTEIYPKLPNLFKKIVDLQRTEQSKLMILASSIGVVSTLMSKTLFIYKQKEVAPLLSVLICAPPGSGKGVIKFSLMLFDKINDPSKNPIITTSESKLIAPANITAAALIDQLDKNGDDNGLLIFETEIDALSSSSGSQYGGQLLNMIRKGIEQEPISSTTKQSGEKRVNKPKLSVVMSGTPSQFQKLFPNNGDGTFSRFCFFSFSESDTFSLTDEDDGIVLDDEFRDLSDSVFEMYRAINSSGIKVSISKDMLTKLEAIAKPLENKLTILLGENSKAILYRHMNFICRMATVFCVVKNYEMQTIASSIAMDIDSFDAALKIGSMSLNNSLEYFSSLPGEYKYFDKDPVGKLYGKLPDFFTTKEAKKITLDIGREGRRCSDYLNLLILRGDIQKIKHGHYLKVKKGALTEP